MCGSGYGWFNQKLYSYKSPSRHRVPSRSIGNRNSRGYQRFPLVFDHRQIRAGVPSFFFFFIFHPPFLFNAVLLTIVAIHGAGLAASRDAVKPWTSLSSERRRRRENNLRYVSTLENVYEKFRSVYCASRTTIIYVYKLLFLFSHFEDYQINLFWHVNIKKKDFVL